jgi:hypothetical protein
MKGGYLPGKKGRGKKSTASEKKTRAKTRRASKIVKKLQSIITRTRRRQSRRR